MTMVEFRGVAPIPAGTVVNMHVNDTATPARAFSVWDEERRILFTEREPTEEYRAEGGYVKAKVTEADIYVNQRLTRLEVSDVKPCPPPKRRF